MLSATVHVVTTHPVYLSRVAGDSEVPRGVGGFRQHERWEEMGELESERKKNFMVHHSLIIAFVYYPIFTFGL